MPYSDIVKSKSNVFLDKMKMFTAPFCNKQSLTIPKE